LSPNNFQNTREALLKHTSEDRIAPFSNLLQIELFPLLEAAVGTLGKQARLLISVVSLQPLAHWLVRSPRLGRRPCSRQSLATAFLAKAVYNLPTTRLLIQRLQTDTQLRRLCGWNTVAQVPTEATFSRAFAEFAAASLPAQIHAALVQQTQQEKVIEHIARDSAAIPARQRPPEEAKQAAPVTAAEKPPVHTPYKTATGWHRRGTRGKKHKTPAKAHRNQTTRDTPATPAAHDAEGNDRRSAAGCSSGTKKNSQGNKQHWRGFKLHLGRGRRPYSHQSHSDRCQRA
jgi:hypothetical protein